MESLLQLIIYSSFVVAVIALFSKVFPWFLQDYRIRKNLREQWKGPPGHWLFGHADVLTTTDPKKLKIFFNFFAENEKRFRYGFTFHAGPRPLLWIHHPDIAKEIFLASAEDAPKADIMKTLFERWLGNGLAIINGGEWHRQRRLLTYSFHFDVLKSYLYHMNSCTDTLQEKWKITLNETKSPLRVEIFSDVSLMTLDAIMQSLVSFKSNCQTEKEKNPFITSLSVLLENIMLRSRTSNPLNLVNSYYYNYTEQGKKYLELCKVANDMSDSFITRRREEYSKGKKNENRRMDFLDTLLQAKDTDGTGLTDYEIRSQLDTFLFGGHDTTSSAISWLLYHLSLHPEYQERCAVEVDAVLGDRNDLKWSDLSSFPFLTRCVKESLRVKASVPTLTRVLNKDIFAAGKTILKGTTIQIGIHGIHMNEEFWKNPEEFDPDRFTLDNVAKQHNYAYLPFAAGQRNCIGQNFALNEIKVVVAKLLREFRFTLDTEHEIIPCHEVVFKTKTGLYLYIEKRI